jgi:hypothetical protein
VDRYDAATIIGWGMLGGGLWMMSPAIALVVCGGLLLLAGVAGAWLYAGRGGGRGSN